MDDDMCVWRAGGLKAKARRSNTSRISITPIHITQNIRSRPLYSFRPIKDFHLTKCGPTGPESNIYVLFILLATIPIWEGLLLPPGEVDNISNDRETL